VNIDLVTLDTMNADSKNIKLSKASSSQLSQSQESLCSNRNVSIGDLLLKIPQLLLEQEIEAFKVSTHHFFLSVFQETFFNLKR